MANNIAQIIRDEDSTTVDFRNLGSTGLRRYSGLIREDYLPQLEGQNGIAIFKEMGESDAVCAGILYAMDKLVRRVAWRVTPASSRPADRGAAEFLEQCMYDMAETWIDHISEFMSMAQYGHSFHEIVYKRRCGNSDDPSMRSKYNDGRIGWRYLPIRSQDTIFRWHFDASGDIVAMEQLAPPTFIMTIIPMQKALLFRTSTHKNNPQGRSIFRGAYRSWYFKSRIENIEAIGAERDVCGIPVAYVPADIMGPDATDNNKRLVEAMKHITKNLKNDEQASVVMPMQYDEHGNKMFDLQLMSSAGTRQFDADKIIQRYDQRIAGSVFFDFMLMGQSSSSTGSFAMHSDKTKMAVMGIDALLDIIASQFNTHAIPRLFRLNSFPVMEYPEICHGGVENVDIKELGDFILKMTQAGMPMFPNPELEEHLCDVANIPFAHNEASPEDDMEEMEDDNTVPAQEPAEEIHDTDAYSKPKVDIGSLAEVYPELQRAEQFQWSHPKPIGT